MNCELRRLSVQDGREIYDLLQSIPKDENGFVNGVNGMSYDEFRAWLIREDRNSRMTEIVDGWKVPQTTYWLYADGRPIAVGKLRHFLTDKLRHEGGHIGYSVAPAERNKGFGTMLLAELLKEAKKQGVDRALLTVQNGNDASVKVALANGGVVEQVSEVRHYIWCNTAKI